LGKFFVLLAVLLLALSLAKTAAAPVWSGQIVDSPGSVGAFSSIALDSSGNPHR
jgi:hypothetical protein